MKRNLIFIVAGGIILIVVGLFVYFIKSGKITPFAAAEATLRLQPPANIVNVGNTFGVNIIADPAGAQAAAVDIYLLHFDKNYLEAQSFSHGDSIFATWMDENLDNTNGSISFSALLSGGQSFTSEKTVGTITFKAKATATSTSATLDCCTVGQSGIKEFDTGRNLLTNSSQAQGGSYTIREVEGETPTAQISGGTTSGTRSPTPTCGGPKQPTCPPTSEVTSEPETSPTPTEIVIGPTATPTSTSTPAAGESPIPTPSVEFFTSPIAEPSVSASPTTVAGFAISKTVALLLYIGIPVAVVMVIFFIWWWKKKKSGVLSEEEPKEDKEEIDDDEII